MPKRSRLMVGPLGIYRMLGRGIARCPTARSPWIDRRSGPVSAQSLDPMLSEQATEDEPGTRKEVPAKKLLDIESPMLGPSGDLNPRSSFSGIS